MGAASQSDELSLSTQIPLAQQYETVQRISRAVETHNDPETLFRAWVAEIRGVVSAHVTGMIHYDQLLNKIRWCVIDTADAPVPFEPFIQSENSVWRSVYEAQRPLIVDLGDASYEFSDIPRFLNRAGMLSACLLPLTTAHRRLGTIFFGSRRPGYFSESVVTFLSLASSQMALGVDNAFNHATLQLARMRLESETVKLKLLLELNNAIVSDLELGSLMQVISPCIRRFMSVDAVALILPDSATTELRVHALDFPGSTPDVSQGLRSTAAVRGSSIAGRVFRSGKPWVGNIRKLEPSSGQDPAAAAGLHTVCVLPLVRRNEVIGVLGLGRVEDAAFDNDAVDFLMQVANQVAIAVENALAYDCMAHLSHQLFREKLYLEDEIRSDSKFHEIVGESHLLRDLLDQVETVAPIDTTVLIQGETGTGKELIARAIHNFSSRCKGPFVRVNCAAMPAGLLESELFGHEKGAFTGAMAQRIGRFELAGHGTIFLDEIGELPLELQPKLLRVLQEREFERIGNSRTLHSSARVIAATNRDLASLVKENKFRPDLFYRLNVFPLQAPSLRQRPEDIPLLVRHFTRHFANNLNKRIDAITAESMRVLSRYQWPGNVRELQNVIERAVILSRGPVLEVPLADFSRAHNGDGRQEGGETLEEAERKHILGVLEHTNWVLSGPNGAAARLGMKRSTLQFRLHKLGISRPGRGNTHQS